MKSLQQKLIITKLCNSKRDSDPSFALNLPHEIGLKLTNRCNLRCTHCYQWNDDGYHHNYENEELKKAGDLSITIVEDILKRTESAKSVLYVWGGEPMVYAHWNEFVNLLERYPRQVVICTNGMFIDKHIESLTRISDNLTMLVSVEGLEQEHNKIRGDNTFVKIINNVKKLLALQKEGVYKGTTSVAGVISDDLIPHLFECCKYYEDLGVDTLHINYPWFINESVATDMDKFFEHNFNWLGAPTDSPYSWHSYNFHLNSDLINSLISQLEQIQSRNWNIRIRFQPNLSITELKGYLEGSAAPVQNMKRCLAISNRMDIMPNGKIVSCKHFPEFVLGDLKKNTLEEIWHGENFQKFRQTLNNSLMPICTKCGLLYRNGI